MGLLGLPISAAPTSHQRPGRLVRVALVLMLALAASPARANEVAGLQIYNASSAYEYAGCWNETTELPDTTRKRALDGGAQTIRQGEMTAPMCLDFCSAENGAYKYAGLEYSRECWCATELNVLSVRLPDGYCNQTCDGAKDFACGGDLKLSVYTKKAAAGRAGLGTGAALGSGIIAASLALALVIL